MRSGDYLARAEAPTQGRLPLRRSDDLDGSLFVKEITLEMMQWPAASEEKSKPSWHIGSCWVAEMLVSLLEKDMVEMVGEMVVEIVNSLEKETVPANGALFSLACTSSVRQLSSKARKTKGSLMSPPFLNKTNQPVFSFLREPES